MHASSRFVMQSESAFHAYLISVHECSDWPDAKQLVTFLSSGSMRAASTMCKHPDQVWEIIVWEMGVNFL